MFSSGRGGVFRATHKTDGDDPMLQTENPTLIFHSDRRIARLLRVYMNEEGISQEEMGRRLGITRVMTNYVLQNTMGVSRKLKGRIEKLLKIEDHDFLLCGICIFHLLKQDDQVRMARLIHRLALNRGDGTVVGTYRMLSQMDKGLVDDFIDRLIE